MYIVLLNVETRRILNSWTDFDELVVETGAIYSASRCIRLRFISEKNIFLEKGLILKSLKIRSTKKFECVFRVDDHPTSNQNGLIKIVFRKKKYIVVQCNSNKYLIIPTMYVPINNSNLSSLKSIQSNTYKYINNKFSKYCVDMRRLTSVSKNTALNIYNLNYDLRFVGRMTNSSCCTCDEKAYCYSSHK